MNPTQKKSKMETQFPSNLLYGCVHFFGLSINQIKFQPHVKDKYWNTTPYILLKSVYDLFHRKDTLSELKTDNFWDKASKRILSFDSVFEIIKKSKKIESSFRFNHQFTPEVYLYGIGGEMHHGKSTVANFICQSNTEKNHRCLEYAFANPLKCGCKLIFGLSNEQVFTDKKDEVDEYWGVTPRYILQQVGTELFRDLLMEYISEFKHRKSIWIENFYKWLKIESFQCKKNESLTCVISDMRFLDESKSLEYLDGFLIKVKRPELTNRIGSEYKHSSEKNTNSIKYSCVIENNGTLEELKDVTKIISEIPIDNHQPANIEKLLDYIKQNELNKYE